MSVSMHSNKTFKEADVILIKKNNTSCFFAKSWRARKIMQKWQLYNQEGRPIYVAQIEENKAVQFLTWLTLQGLLVNSKKTIENIPTLSEPITV